MTNSPGYVEAQACRQASLLATRKFWQAVRRGFLRDLRGEPCADCGRIAATHDHRNYDKWWEVQPTCRRCNVLRGRAAPFMHMRFCWNKRGPGNAHHIPLINEFARALADATTDAAA